MACNCNYLFLGGSGYWLWKLINIFYYCDYVNITHLMLIMIGQQKNNTTTSPKWKWSRPVVSDSLQAHGLQPTRFLHPWDSPGKNTGVGCHFLLQGIFLTQGSNPGLCIVGRRFAIWATREVMSPKLGSNRKICNHFLKSRCVSELSWNFWKSKCSDTAFFLQSSRYVSNEQSCFKTTGIWLSFI